MGEASVFRIGSCVLVLAMCCVFADAERGTSEDAGKSEPQLSADQEAYNVDTSRVYAAGFSGGSFMAQAMAAVHSDLFAACVSWAGYLTYRASTFPENFNYQPIPILQMHSTDDGLVLYEPYDPDPALIGAMPNLRLWLGHNGCEPADVPDGTPNEKGFIEFAGENCDAPVVHYQYSNVGHGGGDPELAFEWALQFTKRRDSAPHSAAARDGSGGGTIAGRVPMSWVFFSDDEKNDDGMQSQTLAYSNATSGMVKICQIRPM